MNTEADLRQRSEALEGENAELRAEIDQLKAERRAAGKAAAKAGGFAALVFVGPRLLVAARDYLRKVKAEGDPLPIDETAALAAAVVGRFVKVGGAGLALGALPFVLLLWQNFLIRDQTNKLQDQIDRQDRDSTIARRAQLLDIIYGEECERPAEVLQRLVAAPTDKADAVQDGTAEGDAEPPDATGEESTDEPDEEREPEPRCWPKAPIRARVEAAVAFLEIERGNEVKQPDLSKATLNGANLSRANLSRANLGETNLIGANLIGAILLGANLREANLVEAVLCEATLRGANLREATLFEADLSEATLREADLSGATLREADLSGATLIEADLSVADLSGATLVGAYLIGANLGEANLVGANLGEASLVRAHLFRANLRGATLIRATFFGANLSRATLFGADLSEATLRKANNLTAAQLEETIGDAKTQIPEGMDRPEHWGLRVEEQWEIIRAKLEAKREAKPGEVEPPDERREP